MELVVELDSLEPTRPQVDERGPQHNDTGEDIVRVSLIHVTVVVVVVDALVVVAVL